MTAAQTPVYDQLLFEHVSPPLHPDDFDFNADLFEFFGDWFGERVRLPGLYTYFRMEPDWTGIGERRIGMTQSEYLHQATQAWEL